MNAAWRLFIAVEIPIEVRTRIDGVGDELRALGWRARWAGSSGTHLTLKFYGDTPVEQIDTLRNTLDMRVRRHRPFDLCAEGAGVFPQRGPARVLWLGISGELGALGELQRDIEIGSQELGFAVERRPFAPHLTIARFRPESLHTVSGLEAELRRIGEMAPIAFQVEWVTLFRSELRPTGAVYTPLARFSLEGGRA